jgi:hypothetical protein
VQNPFLLIECASFTGNARYQVKGQGKTRLKDEERHQKYPQNRRERPTGSAEPTESFRRSCSPPFQFRIKKLEMVFLRIRFDGESPRAR